MRYITYLSLIVAVFSSCTTASNLHVLRTEEQLKSDIDFAYEKLQKLHPRLYWYISKADLDYKFDSLKTSLDNPMSSNEFYFHLSPVVASIKQGHTRLLPHNKKLGFKSIFNEAQHRGGSLYQFEYVTFNDKLFIAKNVSGDKKILPGTEVLSVNHFKPNELISRHKNTFASDGFNQTFIERRLSRNFPAYFYSRYDLSDSVFCSLKYQDTVMTICLKDKNIDLKRDSLVSSALEKEKGKAKRSRKEKRKEKRDKKKGKDEDEDLEKNEDKDKDEGEDDTNIFGIADTKKLKFPGSDSSIAYLKIPGFMDISHSKNYSKIFNKLDSLKTEFLIIDLRDNPGGLLAEAKSLYSYLVDSSFVFIDKSEVSSRWSIFSANYFKDYGLSISPFLAIGYPFEMLSRLIFSALVRKDKDGRYLMPFPGSSSSEAKSKHFQGEVYVLINGGSFSASCILASNLKGSERAIFVGQETGGAYNGTVAGKMKTLTLPESNLNLIFGLATIQAQHKTDIKGRGIFPDIEILPTLQDIIEERDPGLEWILEDIEKKK